MRKKILLVVGILAAVFEVKAQDIQLHYDWGKGRKYLTSTVEMFKPDKYGNTFFFIDMNYGGGNDKGVTLAYWEISRAIRFWKAPVAFHVEYNGGFVRNALVAIPIEDAWLAGAEYSIDAKNYSRGLTVQLLYKYIRGKENISFQLTEVWYLHLLHDKITLDGYADFWHEDFVYGNTKTKFVFQSEPQFWFNVDKNLSFGSEVEVDHNFQAKGLRLYPTTAVKVTF
jgi:Domain of unknown function (DUF5020)